MVLRVFRALVHEGKQDEFRTFFLETALPVVEAQDGLVSVSVGLPLEDSSREFGMVMVWRDLDAVRGFAGETWDRAVVLPEEAHLLAETHVHHYELAGTT